MANKKENAPVLTDEQQAIKAKFVETLGTNVNEHTEKKNGLTYLSWAWAWAEFKKIYPDATYNVVKDPATNLPYFASEMGIMCYTNVTAGGMTYEMWLPVMDSANNAMRLTSYSRDVWSARDRKMVTKTTAAADMFDVNKTIMRCLVKNLAMFGLGLYIYAGEDLPEELDEQGSASKSVRPVAPVRPAAAVGDNISARIVDEAHKPFDAAVLDTITRIPDLLQYYQDHAAEIRDHADRLAAFTAAKQRIMAQPAA